MVSFMTARRLMVGFLVAIALCSARAVDVSGTYENTGAMVGPDSADAAGTISLQGLLELEFDYPLARARHAQTDRVVVRQTAATCTIECKDLDGATTWSGQWRSGVGYGVEAGQVNLLLRSKRFEFDGFLFSLSLAGDRQLLLVDVRRINTTTFGPVAKPVGVFLFNRVPGESPGSSK
jgi:hypothetical protein